MSLMDVAVFFLLGGHSLPSYELFGLHASDSLPTFVTGRTGSKGTLAVLFLLFYRCRPGAKKAIVALPELFFFPLLFGIP